MKELVQNFVDRAIKENLPIEAICLSDKDGLLYLHEFVKRPYRNIFSHTKSFTSTLVGIAIGENKLSLDINLGDTFKDLIETKEQYEAMKKITLQHLLNMQSGLEGTQLFENERRKGVGFPDYVKFYVNQKVKYEPGTHFQYNNGDTYMCGVLLERAVGMTMERYAYEKLFRPLDMPYPVWEHDPFGHTFGASGLYLNIVEMNKLGRLYLNNGCWNGKQIVPLEWVKKVSKPEVTFENDNFSKGYSNQFWHNHYNGTYRADGAYGQITFIFSKDNLTLSIQRPEDDNLGTVLKAIQEEILDKYFKK